MKIIPTIQGSKFTLRQMIPETDKASLWKNIDDPDIINRMTMSYPYTEDQWKWFVEWNDKINKNEVGDYHFVIDVNGEVIGGVGMAIDKKDIFRHVGKLGYWIGKDYWGKGIVSEAVGLIVDFAFNELGLLKLTIDFLEDNNNSKRVAEKNGFQLECVMKKETFKEGKYKDLVYYSKFNPSIKI